VEKISFRKRYTFWLDIGKDNEYQIAEQIELLKATRKFSATIRDGIRLISSLRQGRVDVLFELFPWLKAELQPASPVVETTSDSAIKEQLDRLEKLMVGNGSVKINGHHGPRPMSVSKLNAPNFDDDDLGDIVIRKDTSTDSAQNFLNSMMSLPQ
jgi:hypothetical protein